MKNSSTSQYFILVLVCLTTVFLACKKTETVTITVQQPAAKFSVLVADPFFGNNLTQGSSTYIDSNFYFRNSSDSGDKITYRWDFGDGSSSTYKNPKHSYAKRGSYTVTLIVSNENRAFDTSKQNVSVILGQAYVSLSDAINLTPVAVEEAATNEFVMIGANYTTTYLFQLDSLLKQKSMKTFPSTYRFVSMKSTNDGNYILTGSTQAIDRSDELIKMTANGTLLWNKVLFADDIYSYVAPAPDGGYVVVGSRLYPATYGLTYHTVVIKTDNSGNVQWQKELGAEGMRFTKNGVVENDGIVIAGIKRSTTCWECDSIFVVKLNNSGIIVWKSTVMGGMNNSSWWDTHIAKLSNGNYAVANGYGRGIFFFSPSGDFLDRKLAPKQVMAVMNSADGNIVVLQNEYGNGFRLGVVKLTLDGVQKWYAYPDGRQQIPGGYRCCFDSRPLSIQPLRKGGILVTGSAYVSNAAGTNNHDIVLFMQLDEAGKLK
jgi:hypothetical protein